MIQDELDNDIGNLVRRYSENKRLIGILRSEIGRVDNQLYTLRARPNLQGRSGTEKIEMISMNDTIDAHMIYSVSSFSVSGTTP